MVSGRTRLRLEGIIFILKSDIWLTRLRIERLFFKVLHGPLKRAQRLLVAARQRLDTVVLLDPINTQVFGDLMPVTHSWFGSMACYLPP